MNSTVSTIGAKALVTKLPTLVAALLFLSPHAFAAGPLRIEAAVKDTPDSRFPVFTIQTKIENVSETPRTITIWTCSYGWSWVASRREMVTGGNACSQNVAKTIELKPREEFVQDTQIAVEAELKPGALAFQLGFTPKADWIGARIGSIPKAKLPSSVIWSNDMTVVITPEMVPNLVPPSKALTEKSKHLYCSSYPCHNVDEHVKKDWSVPSQVK
jgi:hypothetical protein